jgi:DNA-binding transcriptional ArsR family regulator
LVGDVDRPERRDGDHDRDRARSHRMAEDLLERILSEIRERKQAAQAAVEETARLERALAALERDPDGPAAEAAVRPSRRARRSSRRRTRAAPGANRDAILAVVRQRPGASAGEVSEATGIPRSTVSPTLARLVDAGAIERTQLPGGVGFRARPAAADDTAPAEPAA